MTAEVQALDAVASAARRPHLLRRLFDWCMSWSESRYGTPALAVMSFAEASFFPIPPDVLQIALSSSQPRRSFRYATVSMVASVLGAILGWLIGMLAWEVCRPFFFGFVPGFTPENFARVQAYYQENAGLYIFTAAFTPIPFKVFTIASGVFSVELWTLFVASVLGRGARFYAVAAVFYFFGAGIRTQIERHFNLATIVLTVLLIGGFLVIKWM
jgi:membrane protein YqaA with SNARE-associated domain